MEELLEQIDFACGIHETVDATMEIRMPQKISVLRLPTRLDATSALGQAMVRLEWAAVGTSKDTAMDSMLVIADFLVAWLASP